MIRHSLVSIGISMSAIAIVMGALVAFATQDICPACHSSSRVYRDWAVPYNYHQANPFKVMLHPERVPGASQFWYCGGCGLCWTNSFDAEMLCDQGGEPVIHH